MLGGGGIVGAERDPGGAIAGDRRGILDAIGRLELRVGLEAEDAAAAIFAGASEKVRERRQLLERGKLVDHAIETALLSGFQAHARADRDIEQTGAPGKGRRNLVGLTGTAMPAVVPLGGATSQD